MAERTAAAKGAAKGIIAPLLFMLGATAILVSLGVWQLHRLTWKEGLIARISARSSQPPAPLPAPAAWPHLVPGDYDYRHVLARGHFDNAKEALVFYSGGPHDAGPGYLILTPLILPSGAQVIVNRGFVPAALARKSARPQSEIDGEVTVTGLMRPPQPRNAFTPADEPGKGLFFTRDPAAIAAHFGLTHAAPFIIDADKSLPGRWPEGGLTTIDVPNNHMNYAMTWFGLATGLWLVFGSFLYRRWEEAREKA